MPRYRRFRCVYFTLEPVHVGSGGYRLGRVDLTIAREPGTNLPKVPGTSLSGAARSYAAVRYGKPEAAGAHPEVKHRDTCPILYTFGTTNGDQGQAGTVAIGDASIVLFPVATSAGPRWVTSPGALRSAGWPAPGKAPASREEIVVNAQPPAQGAIPPMNLGWLLFSNVQGDAGVKMSGGRSDADTKLFGKLQENIVVVHDDLFSHLVNSNLEVRTSVVIDPKTGAAAEKLLFSYEAIPRATVLSHEVVEDDYRNSFTEVKAEYHSEQGDRKGDSFPTGEKWECPWHVARAGLDLIEVMGVGGMGSRGFGRMRMVAEAEVTNG